MFFADWVQSAKIFSLKFAPQSECIHDSKMSPLEILEGSDPLITSAQKPCYIWYTPPSDVIAIISHIVCGLCLRACVCLCFSGVGVVLELCVLRPLSIRPGVTPQGIQVRTTGIR